MTKEIKKTSLDKFQQFMDSSKYRIIKLELLDSYADAFEEEKQEMDYFLKNGKLSPETLSKQEGSWYEENKKLKKKGVKFIRIHVVTLPLNDYMKFEIESYKLSEKYGESIYLIDRPNYERIKPKSNIKITDFLVFDSDKIALNKFKIDKSYNAKKFLNITFKVDKKLASKYINYWESLFKKSIPLKKFIKGKITK